MNFKLITGAALLIAALIFSVQNASVVSIQLLFWAFEVSLSLVIFSALATGLIGGWTITSALRHQKEAKKASSD